MNDVTLLVMKLHNGVSFLRIKRPSFYLPRATTSLALKIHLESILIQRGDVMYLN